MRNWWRRSQLIGSLQHHCNIMNSKMGSTHRVRPCVHHKLYFHTATSEARTFFQVLGLPEIPIGAWGWCQGSKDHVARYKISIRTERLESYLSIYCNFSSRKDQLQYKKHIMEENWRLPPVWFSALAPSKGLGWTAITPIVTWTLGFRVQNGSQKFGERSRGWGGPRTFDTWRLYQEAMDQY